MVTRGLLVRVEAQHDQDNAVAQFLQEGLALVRQEPATIAWFALKFGGGEYGIFDVFPDEAARNAHLNGALATALRQRASGWFAGPPQIEPVDLLAHKLPASPAESPTKAVLLRLKTKESQTERVENFLRDAQRWVEDEPKTLAWFALRFGSGLYGIFDVFPDQSGRMAHLIGRVPRELAKHAFSLLSGAPDLKWLDVLASKIEPSAAGLREAA